VDADYALRIALAVRLAVQAQAVPLAERLVAPVMPSLPLYRHALASTEALLAEAHGEHKAAASAFAEAAAGWHHFGVPYEEAQALLGQGRCLVALGRAAEATPAIGQARAIFNRMGARPALAETDELMARLTASSS
jgi:tetratricopeptide (TPR) repeat protein